MWKSVVGHNVNVKVASEGDDWETDPDFENDVSEQEQRWGSKTVEGSGHKEHISVAELRQKVSQEYEHVKKKEQALAPQASYGYGGTFGVEKDRMDKGAVGHSYVAKVEQHSSQTDAARGFGGKFGVQKDRVDKSAMGFEYKGEVDQHTSQKDYAKGFGGKYGVEKDKVDKAAMGYDYKGETEKHQSQKDYSKGFGGKFGVEKENVDKAALGYDYKGQTEKHESQKDYSKGFGGRFGVQEDRMDKNAANFTDMESPTSAYEKTQPLEASSARAGNLKARFENMAKASDEENRKQAEEEKARRQAREKREQEEARQRQQERNSREVEEVEEVEEQPPPPLPETRRGPPQLPRALPEVPRDEYEPESQVEEEPPCLPPRSADVLPEEAPEVLTPVFPEPQLEEDDGDYEDIANIAEPNAAAVEKDYEDLTDGLTAVAIYDYQGEADDEISFNPDDMITNIEMVDEGWWRGQCHGRFGLFPATFVQLQQ
ncbi:src substrate protein p85-like [Osmerus mordax]|uniref:src substrate protein p85-like n=1 Tax=Osmerus mordax TaxID=8014 RepID=UPI00350F2032